MTRFGDARQQMGCSRSDDSLRGPQVGTGLWHDTDSIKSRISLQPCKAQSLKKVTEKDALPGWLLVFTPRLATFNPAGFFEKTAFYQHPMRSAFFQMPCGADVHARIPWSLSRLLINLVCNVLMCTRRLPAKLCATRTAALRV